MQVSLELQFSDAERLNLTLWGLSTRNSLHLHPPEEEEKDKGRNVEEAGGETKAFYCCYPAPMSSGSVPQGLCLLWLFNQTALRGPVDDRSLLAEKGRRWGVCGGSHSSKSPLS